jgi:hypothetical protein
VLAVPRVALTVLAVAAAALPGCAAVQAADHDPPATAAAGVRAATLAGVARRIYRQEAAGAVGHAAVRRLARDRALIAAMRSGRPAALRAAALRQLFNPGKHVVRLRVLRGGRTLADVGGRFVVSASRLRVHGDVIEASMQDVIGFVKLVHRLTGVQVVVRGAPGHAESSLPGATETALPASGNATIAGHAYVVRSFRERGFGGESLDVRVLSPG